MLPELDHWQLVVQHESSCLVIELKEPLTLHQDQDAGVWMFAIEASNLFHRIFVMHDQRDFGIGALRKTGDYAKAPRLEHAR
jgi:hypothetical protein